MEFKGTKGKWSVSDRVMQNEIGVSYVNIDCIVNGSGISGLAVVYEGITEYGLTELHANAKLISKAPELLLMVQELSENLAIQLVRLGCCGDGDGKDHRADADSYGGSSLLLEASKLIKEATELKII